MSTATVRQVIARAVAEPEFRFQLVAAPTQALAGYDLSPAETAALAALQPESYDQFVAALETRDSRSVPPPFAIDIGAQPTGF